MNVCIQTRVHVKAHTYIHTYTHTHMHWVIDWFASSDSQFQLAALQGLAFGPSVSQFTLLKSR